MRMSSHLEDLEEALKKVIEIKIIMKLIASAISNY